MLVQTNHCYSDLDLINKLTQTLGLGSDKQMGLHQLPAGVLYQECDRELDGTPSKIGYLRIIDGNSKLAEVEKALQFLFEQIGENLDVVMTPHGMYISKENFEQLHHEASTCT